ncbi:MAG: HAD-IA family hydrolase [Candidatus Riflebacteria bacterium]|nr:HAD-IA family hydrolase [Candidatus Riflebacteria bacterium]
MKRSDLLVLCDLGGVLIDLNWRERARALFGKNLDVEVLKTRWLNLTSTRAFEAGMIDFATFYRDFINETGSSLTLDAFKCEFAGILGPLKPDCMSILAELKAVYTLAMLSNTNHLHVEMLKKSSEVFAPFDYLFLSYEMGMVKPDLEIYAEVCARAGRSANKIFFFDDSAVNVAAAKVVGMHAYRVESPLEISKIMKAEMAAGVL